MTAPSPTRALAPAGFRPMDGRVWAELLLLSVVWGSSYMFIKVALAGMPPLTLVLARVLLGALTLAGLLAVLRVPVPRGAALWGQFAVVALFNNLLPFMFIFSGQSVMPRDIAASLSSIVNGMTPIMTVLAAHMATRDEKLTAGKAAGVVAGFAGVATLVAPSLIQRGSLDVAGILPGTLLCLGACVCYAITNIYGRRFQRQGVPALQVAFGQLAMGTLMIVPVALAIDRPWTLPAPAAAALASAAMLGIVCTGLAYFAFFRILGRAGATNAAMVTFLVPVSAVSLSIVFLGETPGWIQLLGLALIASGLAAIDGRLPARLRQRMRRNP